MPKSKFTYDERKTLINNPNVKNVGYNTITYEEAFKLRAVKEYLNGGRKAEEIFANSGLPVEFIGANRIRSSLSNWTIKFKKQGLIGLQDKRAYNGKYKKDDTLKILEKKYQVTVEFLETTVAEHFYQSERATNNEYQNTVDN